MGQRAELVAGDVPFGEGPVWCPDDGTLVCAYGARVVAWAGTTPGLPLHPWPAPS